jgi:hypothetical protein
MERLLFTQCKRSVEEHSPYTTLSRQMSLVTPKSPSSIGKFVQHLRRDQ